MKNKYEYRVKLEGEYLETFDKVEIYYKAKNIENDKLNDAMDELLDLFLSAQSEGRPINYIVGDDLKEFCEIYISETKSKHFGNNILGGIFTWVIPIVLATFILSCIEYFTGEITSIWSSNINISSVLLGIILISILTFIFNIILKNIVFSVDKEKIKNLSLVRRIVFLFLLVIISSFLGYFNISIAFSLRNMVLISIEVLFFSAILYILINKITKGNDKEFLKSMLRQISKRYKKVSSSMSIEEFSFKIEKEQLFTRWLLIIFLLIFLGEFLWFIYLQLISKEFSFLIFLVKVILSIFILILSVALANYKNNIDLLKDLREGKIKL